MNQSDSGFDDKGGKYANIEEMWKKQAENKEQWYSNGNSYWNQIEATVDGVLGGLGFLHKLDIDESNNILTKLFKKPIEGRAIDCGAGIGRIAKDLLTKWFTTVDLVEQNQAYVDKAKLELGDKISNYYCSGLQSFEFQHKYDCIWIQWVASHLTDDDLIQFLQKCKSNLNKDGYIVLKENCCFQGFHLDTQDYSVVRSHQMFLQLINKAGLNVVMSQLQPNFPKNLFKVIQYVLQ